MATATADNTQIVGGVDAHQDLHTAAVVSHGGAVLDVGSFSTTRVGFRAMLRWLRLDYTDAQRCRPNSSSGNSLIDTVGPLSKL